MSQTNGQTSNGTSESTQPKLYLRQPTGFGPSPSPRQDLRTSKPFTTWPEARMHLARIVHNSTHKSLNTLLPAGFEVDPKCGQPTLMYEVMNLRNLPWLAGRGYNTCGVYVGNVVHASSGERGSFLSVLFESLCDPIVTGREELGFPKVFANVTVDDGADTYRVSWDGHEFLRLEFPGAKEPAKADYPELLKKKAYTHPMVDGQLAYRYMPAIGRPGEADAEYCVKQPAAKVAQQISKFKAVGTDAAKLTVIESSFQDLPTLHHIANRLAKVENLGIVEAGIYDLQEASDCGRVSKVDVKRV